VNTGPHDDNGTPPHDPAWYIGHLEREAAAFTRAISTGPLDAPVAGCPGWDVARLASHLGFIHRWARACALNGEPPSDPRALEVGDRDLVEWFTEGAADLVATLSEIDLSGPTWHPFTVARVGGVWPRRQLHETTVHRWDAERAIGTPGPIDPEVASDGIDEYFEVAVPRLIARESIVVPDGSLHVHCTDVAGEWLVWNDGGEYQMKRAHEKGDAALRGPGEAILLRLWGRESDRADELSPVGDGSVLADWLAIAGM
jgi:uncharacterized protein (TIGR03083 family)